VSKHDRITPLEPHKPATPAQAAAGDADTERLKREAVSALRRVGEQQRGKPPPLPDRSRTPVSGGIPVSLPPPSSDPETASKEALRRRAEAAEVELAELRRQDRIRAEAQGPGSYQPPVAPGEPPAQSPIATAQQGARGEPGKPSSVLAQVAALLMAATGLVTATAAILKPAPDTKAAESYTAIRDELVKQNKALQANGDSDEARFNVIIGLFKATGVKVTEAPGTPKIEPLQLQPAPLSRTASPSSAPAIQVRDPLPPPVPSVAPVTLPKTLESLPAKASP
jgi:hypothetical protein